MKWTDCFALAMKQMTRRKCRTALCGLSMAIGVAAMLVITAVGSCGQRQVARAIDDLGLSGLTVYVSQSANGQKLTEKQAAALQAALPQVESAMAVKAQTSSYRTARSSGTAVLLGIGAQAQQVMGLKLEAGTLPNARQIESAQHVAVIDSQLAQTLYGRENVIGKALRLYIEGTEYRYKIIGILQPQTDMLRAALGGLIPTFIYVPYSCLASKQDSADQVFVQCAAGTDLDKAGGQILHFLSTRERVAGTLAVQNLTGAFAQLQALTRSVTAAFLAVAAIALVVALLGMASGMLSATYERTGEIGLYMALGAHRRDITRIFLAQAMLTCFFGGMSGMLFAALLLLAAAKIIGIPLAIPLIAALVTPVLSALCGIGAGILPARRAAALHPVDAMRQ